MRIAADGQGVAVRDGGTVWNPESGQLLFDLAVADLATKAAPIAKRSAAAARDREAEVDAAEWYGLGYDLEAVAPAEARDAYRRAAELDPHHPDAHFDLARLHEKAGRKSAALRHLAAYRNLVHPRGSRPGERSCRVPFPTLEDRKTPDASWRPGSGNGGRGERKGEEESVLRGFGGR